MSSGISNPLILNQNTTGHSFADDETDRLIPLQGYWTRPAVILHMPSSKGGPFWDYIVSPYDFLTLRLELYFGPESETYSVVQIIDEIRTKSIQPHFETFSEGL